MNPNNITVIRRKYSRWHPVTSCLLKSLHIGATHCDSVGGRPLFCSPNPLVIQPLWHKEGNQAMSCLLNGGSANCQSVLGI